jgi:hypothetical protein
MLRSTDGQRIEFGPNEFSGAIETLLESPKHHAVVIRGAIQPDTAHALARHAINALIGTNQSNPLDKTRAQQQIVDDIGPSAEEAGKTVHDWWQQNGYTNYGLVKPHFTLFDDPRIKARMYKHIDGSAVTDTPDLLYGPVVLSVACSNVTRYKVHTIQNGFRDPESEEFMAEQYERKRRQITASASNDGPYQQFTQQTGDIVAFLTHPFATIHGLRKLHYFSRRISYLLEHRLRILR